MELELCVPLRNCGSLLVLGDKAESSFANYVEILRVGAPRRIDPTAAGNESGTWIVEHYVEREGFDTAIVVSDRYCYRVHRGSGWGWIRPRADSTAGDVVRDGSGDGRHRKLRSTE